jgi:ATP-dependent Clp protease adapter protein ClpS
MSIHQQKSVRFTFDMPLGMHRHLKIICAEDDVSMNAFVTKAIEQEFAAREERADEAAVDQAEKDLKNYGTISLADMDKAMGV